MEKITEEKSASTCLSKIKEHALQGFHVCDAFDMFSQILQLIFTLMETIPSASHFLCHKIAFKCGLTGSVLFPRQLMSKSPK